MKTAKAPNKAAPRKKVARRPSAESEDSQTAPKNQEDSPMIDAAFELPADGNRFAPQIDLTES